MREVGDSTPQKLPEAATRSGEGLDGALATECHVCVSNFILHLGLLPILSELLYGSEMITDLCF